ncbi:MAG: leucine-rich repeat protein [Clostridia bacterium]|nr:leucine-rich repeat protein [Clostridia bacterium]
MKKIILFLSILCITLSAVTLTTYASSDYTLNGTAFTVYTADGLMEVAKIINGEAGDTSVLYTAYSINIANDIDMSGKAWKPIGKNDAYVYTGTVNGNGHTVSNLTRKNYSSICLGFIGTAGVGARVQDLNFENVNFTSSRTDTAYVGGIIGKAKGAGEMTVSACTVSGNVQNTTGGVGGFVGAVTSSYAALEISNCTFDGNVASESIDAGSLVGFVKSGASVTALGSKTVSGSVRAGTVFTVYSADALMDAASKVNSDTAFSSAVINIGKNIDMNGKTWIPIGKDTAFAFKGAVNGNGHTVSNLTSLNYTAENLGFVGVAGGGAAVKDLHLENLDFKTSANYVGGIIANVTDTAQITGCTVQGSIYTGGKYAGGLVGVVSMSSSYLTVSNCAVDADICAVGHSASGIVGGDTASGYNTSDISTFPTVKANKVFLTGNYKAENRVSSFMGYNFCVNADFRNCISLATLSYTKASENGAFMAVENYSKIYLENCTVFSDLHAFYNLSVSTSVQTVELKNCYLLKDKIGKAATLATYNKYSYFKYDASVTNRYKVISDIVVDGVGPIYTPFTTTNTSYCPPVIQYNLPSGTESEVMTRAYNAAMAMFEDGSRQESLVHKHTWQNGNTVTAPTYTNVGTASYSCSKCSAVKSVEVPCKESNVSFTFDKNTKTLTVSGVGSMGKFATPSTIPWKEHRAEIVNVIIEKGIVDICDYAFYDCTALKNITIPSGVTLIGAYSFHNCRSLASVTLPSTVKTIYNHAFEYCSGLEKINIPSSVTSIGYGVFRYAKYATPVITSASSKYKVIGNCLIDVNAKAVTAGFLNSTLPTDPALVTSVGKYAFQGCKIKEISIPSNITGAGEYAFADCTALKTASVSANLTDISEGMFYGCSSLDNVTLYSVTSIGALAFNECTGLKNIIIPSTLSTVDISAFKNCISLAKAAYTGTSEQWNSVSVALGNDILKSKVTYGNTYPAAVNNAAVSRTALSVNDIKTDAHITNKYVCSNEQITKKESEI